MNLKLQTADLNLTSALAKLRNIEESANSNSQYSAEMKAKLEESERLFAKAQSQMATARELTESVASLHSAKQGIVDLIRQDPVLLTRLTSGVVFPPGLIAAFDRSEGSGACPSGWKRFDQATGRVIVGAGSNSNKDLSGNELTDYPSLRDDPVRAVGGEEKHVLSVDELPPHDHAVYRHAAAPYTGVGPYTAGSGSEDASFRVNDNWKTGIAGGGKPYNNMPPFVALYYCIKEE